MSFRVSRLYVVLVCSLLATATLIRWADPFFVRALRLIAFDGFQRLDPLPYNPDPPVRIIDIDDKSLELYGQWPWSRATLRDLVAALADDGAAAIAFDILFSEPDQSSLEQIVKRLPADQAAALSEIAAKSPGNDRAFADTLAASPSVLAVVLTNGANATFKPKAGFAVAGDDPREFVTGFSGAVGNVAVLEQAARGVGAINWIPDRDQVIRRASLVYRLGDTYAPSLAAEALRVAQDASTYVLKSSNASGETAFGKSTGLNHIGIGDLVIPTDADGGLTMRFRRSEPESYIAAWKVLSGQIDRQQIAGRILLIGSSAPGLFDVRATPLDAAIPGVEIHAQLIEHVLTGRYLSRPDYAIALEELLVIGLGLALALLLPKVSASASAAIGLATIAGVLAGSWVAFAYWGLLLDPLFPTLSLGCFITVFTFHVFRRVEAQRGEIRLAFGRYLAPAVVEQIVANPDRLVLGGEIRELTLMFSDVRDFTTISENLNATELTNFINELLTPLSAIILQNRGTIDKYMGDGIMAFWNAPLDDPQHAAHACESAIAMARKMEELNRQWGAQALAAQRPFKPVRIGIGINSGNCCVGNLGSTLRFDYSAIGDEVNVTSRLEGLSKIYGVTAVVGEHTMAAAPFPAFELDAVRVKGRSGSTRLFTFLALLHEETARLDRLQPIHMRFLAAYRAQRWAEAERLIAECRELDVPRLQSYYALFASRIESFRQAGLPAGWDGTFTIEQK
jgi:adenylate cyclase